MKKLTLSVFIAALLVCAGAEAQQITGSYATGSSATTNAIVVNGGTRNIDAVKSINIEWISTSGGAATVNIDGAYGTIERVTFAPVASASPTASYDVVLEDVDDIDVLGGKGANLSATAASTAVPLISTQVGTATNTFQFGHKYVVDGQTMQLKVTNAGNAKRGIVRIYMKN